MSNVIRTDSEIKFVIAGDGPLLKGLINKCMANFESSRYEFLGFIDAKDHEKFWGKVGVFASTAKNESYGRTIRESLVRGIPVLATKNENSREILETMDDPPIFFVENFDWENFQSTKIREICSMETDSQTSYIDRINGDLGKLIESWKKLVDE
jgi:glycosyltransferase involved in cell wall biosynthesis